MRGRRRPRWPRAAPAALALVAAVAAGCSAPGPSPGPGTARSWAPREERAGGLRRIASTAGGRLVLRTAAGPVDFVPGVNVGATVPGRYPSEMAVTAAQYRRWFRDISDLGLRSVRVYALHPPAFYDELAAHNRARPDTPLYLVQGVHLPEDWAAGADLFAPAVVGPFRAELGDASAAVHGDLERPARPGAASGRWRSDVSPWLLAYLVGSELDPLAVAASDRRNAGRPQVAGTYFASRPGSTPTERWMAGMLDLLATEEARRGRTVPLAFVNWPTTDPLRHPEEPLPEEDLVGVDANHVAATAAWPGGYFASYHAYPYYPDFLRHEPGLNAFRHRGRSDPYAGYLAALAAHHAGLPVVVSEFGVPSSAGSAHRGPLGRDQGGHSEAAAMATDAGLLRMIHDLGLSGGFVFEWQDEWFKQTWNTRDTQVPADRRALWHDAWTNEQHFGLQAVEPADAPPVRVLYRGGGPVREVAATHDAAHLRLRVRLASPPAGPSALAVGFDVVPGGAPLPGAVAAGGGADYAVTVDGAGARAWVRSAIDPLEGAAAGPDGPAWSRRRLLTGRPVAGRDGRPARPAEHHDVGRLVAGDFEPGAAGFDSRASWRVSGSDVELRLPWAAVGMSDPSSRRALVVSAGGFASVGVAGVGVSVAAGGQEVGAGYTWEPWDSVRWRARPKAGLAAFAAAVRAVQPGG